MPTNSMPKEKCAVETAHNRRLPFSACPGLVKSTSYLTRCQQCSSTETVHATRKGMTPTPAIELANAKPVVVDSATSPDSRGAQGSLDQTSNPRSEEEAINSASAKPTSEVEVQLVGRIDKLWSTHNKKRSSVKQSREELKRVRVSLSIDLHTYKKLLVGTGRDGGWTPFLVNLGIPLSTADRYVKRQEDALARSQGK